MLMAAGLLLAAGLPRAQEIAFDGARFEAARSLGGDTLLCNGVGKRTILFFDAYHAALYAGARYADFDALRQADQPRILELRLLRDAPLSLLEKVVTDGIRDNAPPGALPGLQARTQMLLATMRAVRSLNKGDVLEIVYTGGATHLKINQARVGADIAGKDFNDALLSIWLGAHPIDSGLKRQLLGMK
ncbi:chalcone isomerase family protein [Chitinimonas koreensis]|uniref:chalcone isomerase family protein n=1 Tax=Chitinimonas koreensis TaxID=356302 RepID=UPI000405ED24|nr:chalcone isomerase family protein [Chitinimonas koreensis]QNM98205.1 chalcone isomerase family protein [Chitinimonas koreensis]